MASYEIRSGHVYVTPLSFAASEGTTTPDIQRAVDAASASGDVVHIKGNTVGTPYVGNVTTAGKSVTLDPGASPAQVFLTGDLTLDANDTFVVEFTASTAPGVTYDQWVITGMVNLGGATLNPGSSSLVAVGDQITLISNDGGDAVTGTFAGYANGSVITIGGQYFIIFYNGGSGNDVTLTRYNLATVGNTYAEDTGWLALPNGTFILDAYPTIPGNQSAVKGFDAFDTIQQAINAVVISGTVFVNAGTYVEDVTISKSLTLHGTNAGINPNTGSRIAEAIIRPASSNPDPFATTTAVVNITASNVTVDGFIVDGDNTTITSGVLVNGVDVDATDGIFSETGVGNITVQNNVVRNTSYTGLNFDNLDNLGAVTSDNYLRDNKLTNIGHIPYGYGIGILVYDNFYAQITGNVMTDVRLGVQTGNFYLANTGAAALIDNNTISSTRIGIYHNLAYSAASPFTITNNTVNVVNEIGNTRWFGIAVMSIQGTVGVTVSNNTINAAGVTSQLKSGYFLWNNPTTSTVTVSGGSVTGADYGFNVTNRHPGFGDGASFSAIITGVSIANSSTAGIFVNDNPANANNATVGVTVTGNTTVTGSPTGILVSGSDASANINNNLLSINGNVIGIDVNAGSASITSNSIYNNGTGIRFTNGGSGSVTSNNFLGPVTNFLANDTDLRIDASAGAVTIGSSNLFGGGSSNAGQFANPIGYYIDNRSSQSYNLVGSGSTFNRSNGTAWTALSTGVLTDNFRIEDRLYHAPDNAASGLIRVVTGNVYVSQPGTGANDESIQLAINAASVNDTVNLERGTHTLTSTVNVNKPVTLLGEGTTGITATTVTNPTVNQDTFDFTGINAPAGTVNFQNFRVAGSGAVGIDYVVTQGPLGTISLSGMLIENNKWNGLGIFGANAALLTGMNVNVTNSTFNDNGEQAGVASSLGNGDLLFFLYNGNANLTNVTVDGYAANGANNGIQFRGSDTPQAAGTLTFNNVSVLGSYLRPTFAGGGLGSGILIQNYTTVGALSFTGSSINLVNGIGFSTAGVTGTIDLANTSINVGVGYFIATGTSSQNNVPTNVTATNTTLGGVAMLGATNAQYFTAEDRIGDRIDVPSTLPAQIGLVRLKAGNVFVTPNSFISPFTAFADIQRGIDASSNGETVWVAAGTFNNDLLINKSINLFGAGIDTTYVYGVGPTPSPYASAERGGATMQVLASGVVVDGFTISRLGNNVTDWNNADLNSAGLAVQGQTNSVEVRYSKFIGNRTGIDVNNSNGNFIHNNIIDNNRTGLIFRNQTDNTTVSQNFITNNWTVGVLFLDGSGTGTPVQSAANSSFFNNNISGNWYGQIVDRQFGGSLPVPGTNIKNFSGNWLGTTSPVVTTANSAEPGYAAQIPVIYGGSAVPPGGQPDIAGGASANIDFSPYLGTGVDLDSNPNNGFQGDFSNLWVTTAGAQSGPTSRITEALGLATSGGTITILGGTYVDNVNTTAQPISLNIGTSTTSAQVTITGSLTMGSTTTVNFNMTGPNTTTPVGGTDYDQIVTTGATNLGGATFNITKAPAYFPVVGANFALIRSTLSKTGSFNYGGLVAENAIIAVGGINFKVNYNLGSGPFDLNLGVVIPNNIVYVWSGWSGQNLGDFYQVSPPSSSLAAPPGGYATFTGDPVTFGYNAYSTIQDAINAVSSGATIRIYIGTYTQDITVSSGKNNLQLVAFGAAGTRTINGVVGGPSATITLQGTGTIFSGNSAVDNFVVNQTAADNLAGIRTAAGSLGSNISNVNVSGSNNATAFTGVDVGTGTWLSYSNGQITNYRTGIKVNNGAGSVSNPVDIQNSTINGSGWASLTVMPAGVDVGLNGYAKLTNGNTISGNRWGVRVLGGTAMLQGNNLSGNSHTGASAAGLFVANGGVVDAGQVIDTTEVNYTGLGISTGGNNFATGYAMGGAQAIVNLNANFGGPPSGTANLTDGTNVSARNNNFGTTVYGNIEQVVNHAIDNSFQAYVDYRSAVGAASPTQEGATQYYAVTPVTGTLASQRSIIRGVQFVIDSPVTIQSGALDIIRTDSSAPEFDPDNQDFYLSVYGYLLPVGSVPLNVTSSVSGATGRTTVNITFQASSFTTYGSLVDGFYERTVNSSLVDLLFSGSGVNYDNAPVTEAQTKFHRLFGDVNGDQFINGFDNARFQNAYRVADSLYAQTFDYNNSGVTFFDLTDFQQFQLRLGGGIL
ncbi:MAG: right-handed parallel beta-helix repeat-containing protein [Gemmatales bacterium]